MEESIMKDWFKWFLLSVGSFFFAWLLMVGLNDPEWWFLGYIYLFAGFFFAIVTAFSFITGEEI
jgi:hypothetical protein